MTPRIWRGPEEHPRVKGWYIVERLHEPGEKIRAWGNGLWWVPLPDGWISMTNFFRWHLVPVALLGADRDRSPLEEMRDIQARLNTQIASNKSTC